MNESIRQHIFNDENIKLFYLSPYAEVKTVDDQIVLMGQERENAVLLPIKGKKTSILTNRLKNGMEEDELKNILSDILGADSEDWLYSCIWEGIIE